MFFRNDIQGLSLSQTELAYNYILDKILSCEYLPGQEISEKMLNEELSFGRTPIREALMALKSRNLVMIYPRKGMRVRPFTPEYINEIYQIRKIMEPSIITQFKGVYSKNKIIDYQRQLENSTHLSDLEFYQKDIEFHMYFIEMTRNHSLIQFYENIMIETYRLAVYAAIHHCSCRDDNIPQHNEIIKALMTENDEQISMAVSHHINHSLITLTAALEKIPDQSF